MTNMEIDFICMELLFATRTHPAAAPLLAFLQTQVLNENGWLLLIDNSARAAVEAKSSVLRAPSNYIEFSIYFNTLFLPIA